MSYPLPAVLLGLLSLGTLVPVHAQTFGRTDVGAIPSAGLTANAKRGAKFTPPEPGTATGLCAYLDGNGGVGGRQDFRLALYSDKGGVPDSRLAETSQITILSGDSAVWHCFDIGLVPVSTVPYWIVIHTGPTGGVIRDFADGPANWFGNNVDTFSDGASNPFGSGNFGSGTMSVYASFTPASQLTNSGRTTIGSTPSAGMPANFKRGSSFTVNESGRLSALTAYVDGLGGAGGSQQMRLAVYRDANGAPGARISQAEGAFPPGGMRARWITLRAEPAIIEPGRYWLVIHTGVTGGVLRNYGGDGGANWYGNADLYEDGASPIFGAGNHGNGTLSAFASYEPGPFVIRKFGRTDIGVKPSKGLTANFMRGSEFTVQDPRAVLTGLHAYLDGNGGAPGTQKVRMVLYELIAGGSGGFAGSKLAESAEVSIAAGTPPGWVHFPVPAENLDQSNIPVYYIMIHSGDTGGVVRSYGGDGGANWLGIPDSYEDFGERLLEIDSPQAIRGQGTLSIHATYSTPAD